MRINRLDLTRYGIFTDYSISFGERTEGPDLHVIYGPNEAGKSTALAACLDLLFGIETRSSYNFLHPYPTMRIGAEIEINGTARQFTRLKRSQNSLLDGEDKPIFDGSILGDLGGIDRHAYTTMFSLDDETIEAGGESILASQGDLGQLLFAASAGLSDLSQKLVELKLETDRFYKFRSRGGVLSGLKTRLDDLKTKRDDIDMASAEYARLVEDRERAQLQYDQANAECARMRNRILALQRQLNALPRLLALRNCRQLVSSLAHVPAAPAGWIAELPALKKADIELATRAAGINEEIDQIADGIQAIEVDASILGFAGRIDRQAEWRARYVTAAQDIPQRQLELHDREVAISGILHRLGRTADTDPRTLLPGAALTGTLRDLMEQKSGIDSAVQTALEEYEFAMQRHRDAETKLLEAGGATVRDSRLVQSRLASALAVARASDHAARLRLAMRAQRDVLVVLEQRMRALAPWTGDAEALRSLVVPDAIDIEKDKKALDETERCIDFAAAEITRLEAEQRRLSREVAAVNPSVPGDQQIAEARTAREQTWARHKQCLDSASAEAFEARLRLDDLVTSQRLASAGDLARRLQHEKALGFVNADLETAQDRWREARNELQNMQLQVSATISSIASALPANWSLEKLASWLAMRQGALESFAAFAQAEQQAHDAETDEESLRLNLSEAAKNAGIDFPLDAPVETLIALIQEALDRKEATDALRNDVAERKKEVEERKRKVQQAEAAANAWTVTWEKYCRSCWLANDGAVPSVAVVREMLIALDELFPLVERRASLAERIEQMQADQRDFVNEICALSKEMQLDTDVSPLDLYGRVTLALDKARMAKSARDAAVGRLKNAQLRKAAIAQEQQAHDVRKTRMLEHFKLASLDDVEQQLHALQKRNELTEQGAATEQEILITLGLSSISDAEQILDSMDRSAAEAEFEDLSGRCDDQDQRARTLFSELGRISDRIEAVGGDDAVARIEAERRTTLLEIEEGAKTYLRLKLGVMAAERALEMFRDEHRSSMMARASEAFSIISRGAYKGLATQPDKDREVLVVVQENDSSKLASALSKGTRFQLYLALRVAGYQEFARSRPSVPFIADDIMETFDDLRAAEAFRLFVEMAREGQVIYFTHHQHLCDIAQRVCPQVRIHQLRTKG